MDRDLGVTEAIRGFLPEWTVPIFEAVAMAGDLALVVSVLAAIVFTDAYRSLRRGSDHRLSKRTAFLVGIVIGGLALTLVLKTVFGVGRPPEELQAAPRDGNGFPSGHTMAATVFWGSLAAWSRWRTRRVRTVGAAGIVGLVGFSRLALGVHYLVDVLASVVFGIGYLALAAWLLTGEPGRAFATAAALGVVALVVTGANTDGLLTFGACVGGAVSWWLLDRPTVRRISSEVTD